MTVPSSNSWSVALVGKGISIPGKSSVLVAEFGMGIRIPPFGGKKPSGFEKGRWPFSFVVGGGGGEEGCAVISGFGM